MRPRFPVVSRWLHRRKSRRFFRPFVEPGELVFDVGKRRPDLEHADVFVRFTG